MENIYTNFIANINDLKSNPIDTTLNYSDINVDIAIIGNNKLLFYIAKSGWIAEKFNQIPTQYTNNLNHKEIEISDFKRNPEKLIDKFEILYVMNKHIFQFMVLSIETFHYVKDFEITVIESPAQL